jgi:hypothetical protein
MQRRGHPKIERWNSRAVLWPCKDCGHEVSPVINGKRHTWGVSNALWKEAGMRVGKSHWTGEYLCWNCLRARIEARRGHKPTDFELLSCVGYSTNMSVSRKQWSRWLRARRRPRMR